MLKYGEDQAQEDLITARVAAGGVWLSMIAPGWRARMDWDRLDLGSCVDCVAGQVFAHACDGCGDGYAHVCSCLKVEMPGRRDLGLTSSETDYGSWDLEVAWRSLWGPQHVDYPHVSGTLYDCPACEASGELDPS